MRHRFRQAATALGLVVALVFMSLPAAAAVDVTPLVSTAWLADHLGTGDLVVVDVRKEADFAAGHVPGAVRTDFPGAWRGPRGVVPPVAETAVHVAALGISNDTTMVIVPGGGDGTEFGISARIYWAMKYLGHDSVAILDGGWTAWSADAANPIATGESTPTPVTFTADVHPEVLATTDEVRSKLGTDTILVDARPPSQYLGETKSNVVAKAGHIPGAINLPYATLYDAAASRLRPVDQLEAALPDKLRGQQGADVIAYCNTGWWSAIDWFVLHELLGYQHAHLYVESMAGWTADPKNPVVTGPASAD